MAVTRKRQRREKREDVNSGKKWPRFHRRIGGPLLTSLDGPADVHAEAHLDAEVWAEALHDAGVAQVLRQGPVRVGVLKVDEALEESGKGRVGHLCGSDLPLDGARTLDEARDRLAGPEADVVVGRLLEGVEPGQQVVAYFPAQKEGVTNILVRHAVVVIRAAVDDVA